MLGIYLSLLWMFGILPAMYVGFSLVYEGKGKTRDGVAVGVVLFVFSPVTLVAFLCWALCRTARLLLGLVHTPAAAMKSNPKENASS